MTLLADGFSGAFKGYGQQFNKMVAVYDYPTCINILVDRDRMTAEEAHEYMAFNVLGAYLGDSTPVFLGVYEHESIDESVDTLELTVRASNCLRMAHIYTIRELVDRTSIELLRITNLGRKTLEELEEVLAKRGLKLRQPGQR